MQSYGRSTEAVTDWLAQHANPSVRFLALRDLQSEPTNDPKMLKLQEEISGWIPAAGLLAAQNPRGYWRHPEDSYWPKWSATVWSLILLAELGIRPDNQSVVAGSEFILKLAMTQDQS